MKHKRERHSAAPHTPVHTTEKKQKKVKQKGKPTFKGFVNTLFLLVFIALLACMGILAGMYAAISQEMDNMDLDNIAMSLSSVMYYTDSNGNAYEAETIYDSGNRIWVNSEEISPLLKEAVISIEDERFMSHNGIDIKRTAGAFAGWVMEKFGKGRASYGGSTITQQVIKNITQEKERTPTRKIKEMMRAVALERRLSKDEILTVYLNIIYLANNCNGVESASNLYFGKEASELTLSEAALIAGITQKPSYYDPLKNPDNAVQKRNTVLAKMYELGKISEEEYEAASASDIGLAKTNSTRPSHIYSYFADQVIREIISDLQTQKGYSETYATQLLFGGGLKIYTTMDYNIQTAMEEVFEDTSNFPSSAKNAQAAMVIIDPSNGEVKALVGGKGKKTDSRGFNRATQMKRQPGSSIKPISVYSPAIDTGTIDYSTILHDEPITIGDWSPKNSYSGFKGDMTLKRALEISANIPAVEVLQKTGISTGYSYATKKFGLSTLVDADKALSPLSLGGLTNGVTPVEMAAAYAVFANGGEYNAPHTYTKVLDSSNKVILENEVSPTRAVSKETAYIMNTLLYNVVNGSSGTGKAAKLSSMPTYGKTGTTNNDYDKWFIGYTPYYVGAAWYGFDTPSSIRNAGVRENVSARIWKSVMEKAHEGLAEKDFDMPDSIVEVRMCANTGKLASKSCSNAIDAYFASGSEPTKYCKDTSKKQEATPTPSAVTEPETSAADTEESPQPDTSVGQSTPEATAAPTAPPETSSGNDTPVVSLD